MDAELQTVAQLLQATLDPRQHKQGAYVYLYRCLLYADYDKLRRSC